MTVSTAERAEIASDLDRLVSDAARGLYIDGRWQNPNPGKWIDVADPATSKLVARVPDGDIGDAMAAIDAAASLRRWAGQQSLDEAVAQFSAALRSGIFHF